MGADSPAENIPNASKNFQPKISVQAKMFEIFEKSSVWVSVVRAPTNVISNMISNNTVSSKVVFTNMVHKIYFQ